MNKIGRPRSGSPICLITSIFVSSHNNLLLCWGRVLRHETKHSTEVTRFNRYFINNNNKKKKKKKEKEKKNLMKIHIIINNNINIDNDNNNNSNEDLDSLPKTEPQYRF